MGKLKLVDEVLREEIIGEELTVLELGDEKGVFGRRWGRTKLRQFLWRKSGIRLGEMVLVPGNT